MTRSPQPVRLPADLPDPLRRSLLTFARARAVWSAAAEAALGLLLAGFVAAVACTVDRLIDTPGAWRLPLTLLSGLTLVTFTARSLYQLLRQPDYDEVAHALDRAHGDGRGHLRSALDFMRRGLATHTIAGWALERTVMIWAHVQAVRYVDHGKATRRLLGLAVLMAAIAASALVPGIRAGLLWQRFLRPLGNHMRPSATWFEVEPPSVVPLHAGDDYTLRARLVGRPVARPAPIARITYADGSSLTRKMQVAGDGSWQAPLADIRQPFAFVVSMDRARSARYAVDVLPRPVVDRVTVTYDYPRYTNLKKKTETLAGRTITALEGTKVRVELQATLPLREAIGRIGDEFRRFTVNPREPRQATCYLFLSANGRMDLNLVASNGLAGVRETPLQLRVISDAPPAINISGQWEPREYYLSEVIDVAFKAQDDLGLMQVILRSGSFEQEAELTAYGVKEAQGTLSLPLSIVARPGDTSVKFRMYALDGKGQSAASREVTLRLAINSYDRQLKRARTALAGRTDARDLTTWGYPTLERHQNRLEQLRTLGGKLVLLRESLKDNARPGADEERVLKDIRGSLAYIQPAFDYVRIEWDGARFAWISGAQLPARLQAVVRDAVCGAEIAIDGKSLAAAVNLALTNDNPKVALGNVTPALEAAVKTQEDLVRRLAATHRMVQVELAGYLAATLDARLERASPADWSNGDYVMAVRAAADELRGLLSTDVAAYSDLASNTTFVAAFADKDTRAALGQLKPLLAPLVTNLADVAFAMATNAALQPSAFPSHAGAGGPASAVQTDLHAVWLVMQSGSPGSDPVARLQETQRFLQMYGGGGDAAFRPVGDGSPAVRERQETAFRVGMTVARMHAGTEALRLGMTAGYLASGKPELESLWIHLREGYLDLVCLKDRPALDAGVRNELAALTGGALLPLKQWAAEAAEPALLAATAREWETALQALALRLQPETSNTLRAFDADLAGRWPVLQAGADALHRDIGDRVAALEHFQGSGATNAWAGMVYFPVWSLQARQEALQQALLSMLDVTEACRLQTGGGTADLERLTLARSYARKVSEYIRNPLLNLQNEIGRERSMKGAVMTGKIKEYHELDRLVGEFAAVCAAVQPPEEVARRIKDNMLTSSHERERTQLRSALGMEAGLRDATNLVRSIVSERAAAAAVWGPVCQEAVLLREAIQSNEAPADANVHAAAALELVRLLDPLPKDLDALPDILTGCMGDLGPAERRAQAIADLDGVLDDLRPLAQPLPPPLGREQAQADLLAVNRSRAVLAAGRPDIPRLPLLWAVTEMEWNRRKVHAEEGHLALGGLALLSGDDLDNLRLPKHLYLELKRAREHAMPDLFKERSYQYLNRIMEQAR